MIPGGATLILRKVYRKREAVKRVSWSEPLPSRQLVSRGGDHAARADPRVVVELAGPSPPDDVVVQGERMSGSCTHPRFPWRNEGIPCPRDTVSGLTGPGGRVFIKIGRYPSVRPMLPKTRDPREEGDQ